jgi:hypothetical protein
VAEIPHVDNSWEISANFSRALRLDKLCGRNTTISKAIKCPLDRIFDDNVQHVQFERRWVPPSTRIVISITDTFGG